MYTEAQIVKEIKEHLARKHVELSYCQLCISTKAIYSWQKIFSKFKFREDSEIQELEAENTMLRDLLERKQYTIGTSKKSPNTMLLDTGSKE